MSKTLIRGFTKVFSEFLFIRLDIVDTKIYVFLILLRSRLKQSSILMIYIHRGTNLSLSMTRTELVWEETTKISVRRQFFAVDGSLYSDHDRSGLCVRVYQFLSSRKLCIWHDFLIYGMSLHWVYSKRDSLHIGIVSSLTRSSFPRKLFPAPRRIRLDARLHPPLRIPEIRYLSFPPANHTHTASKKCFLIRSWSFVTIRKLLVGQIFAETRLFFQCSRNGYVNMDRVLREENQVNKGGLSVSGEKTVDF